VTKKDFFKEGTKKRKMVREKTIVKKKYRKNVCTTPK
jgi:hypothetical protein